MRDRDARLSCNYLAIDKRRYGMAEMSRSLPGNSPRTTLNPACHVIGDEPDRLLPQLFPAPALYLEGGEAF